MKTKNKKKMYQKDKSRRNAANNRSLGKAAKHKFTQLKHFH